MKRKILSMLIGVSMILSLSGCSMASETVHYLARTDEGMIPADAATPVEVESQTNNAARLELETDILGVYENGVPVSRLVADKDYEILARVLLSADAEAIRGQELDFLLICPTVAPLEAKTQFGVQVLANGSVLSQNEFAVTVTSEDLSLGYVPETYQICVNGDVALDLQPEKPIWNEFAERQEQDLDYLVTLEQALGVYEYTLSYQVRTKALDDDQEAVRRAETPISLELLGISQVYADGRDDTSALMALNDCLRENYLKPESMLCEGTVYLAAEVTLPEWAREYAEKYGLRVDWYNYLEAPGCGVGVSLPGVPDNLGRVEASFQDLAITTLLAEDSDCPGILNSCPTTPLSIWRHASDEVFALKNLTIIDMPGTSLVDTEQQREYTSQLVGGEIITQIPENGRFYLVFGTDLMQDTAE